MISAKDNLPGKLLRAATRINEDLRNIVIDSVQTIFNAFVVHVFEYVSFENLYVKRWTFSNVPDSNCKKQNLKTDLRPTARR